MNPLVRPRELNAEEPWDYPLGISPDNFIRLTKLQLDAVAQEEVDAIRRFTKAWLEGQITNQAIRADGHTLKHEIGHEQYGEALTWWRNFDRHTLDGNAWKVNHQAVLGKL
jgi:hypothetical protein